MIAEERQRQIEKEGYTSEHDDVHDNGDLACAAAAYMLPENLGDTTAVEGSWWSEREELWPFPDNWKPTPEDRIKEIVKACALGVAEIERLQRLNK